MSKIYIVFEDESTIENGLPKGVLFITSGIFAVADADNIPEGAREATAEEMSTPDELLAEAGRDIEAAADQFQTQFLGASSSKREARFARNLAAAKRLIADDYTEVELSAGLKDAHTHSLTMQAQAQNEGRSVEEFAQWIVEWEGPSGLIAGAIESFIKTSKLGLADVPNLIDPAVKAQHYAALKQQAQAMLAQMTA